MKIPIICAMLCLAFLAGCKKTDTSYVPSCTGASKSWANEVKPLLTSNCVSCHTSYSSYSNVVAEQSNIRSKIVDGTMPKGGSLSTDQKNIIVCWIDNGALNN